MILTLITHNDGENDGVNTKVFRPFIQYLIEAPFAVITVAGFPGHVFKSLAHLNLPVCLVIVVLKGEPSPHSEFVCTLEDVFL